MNGEIITVIVPTYNSSAVVEDCLVSIKNQDYENIEIIVVDNNSKDNTKEIASKYTENVFNKGPERSAQRNFGVKRARGQYVCIVDSDMKLSKSVISSCLKKISSETGISGLVIPEESFGVGFWAKCKQLERSFYEGIDWMEAARFFPKSIYEKIGGYDEDMVSGEDWDLSQKVKRLGNIDRIDDKIYHNEGRISLIKTIRKKMYYAEKIANYVNKNTTENNIKKQTGIFARYSLFMSRPMKLLENPIIGLGMLFMKTCEFVFGGIGYLKKKISLL